MAVANRHNLRRDIPAEIKRQVRQRCGFGCVVCGSPFIHYHHFNPPFADAVEHRSECITLLCGADHDRASRGLINGEALQYHDAHPYCHQSGKTRYTWMARQPLGFRMASRDFLTRVALMYETTELIGYAPELPGEPQALNATILDRNGRELLRLHRNEWCIGADRYDITATGKTVEVREASGDVVLRMDFEDDCLIHIRKLTMDCGPVQLACTDEEITIDVRRGGTLCLKGERTRLVGEIGVRIVPSAKVVEIGTSLTGAAAICMPLA